ncbi:MAG: bifunctional DNA-formamidopyrimidine glycosylase/DNA-(apurinic or apyrimidinic site) lyase [Phycisphaera sp.]|nr:MAG: bifunctional DNA-formamidopyrimidine glycosylase/DNA-(apurinic or apyrimidinic site) lyase [Phycisphaera sp.]
MPELPEVEHLRRTLEPRLLGRRVVGATLHRRDVAVGPADPPGGFARQRLAVRPTHLRAAQLLADATIGRIDRRGKLLAILAGDGRALGVHLGMSGQLLWAAAGRRLPTDHVHATWRLDDRSRLIFRDPRRFGGLWLAQSRDELPPWRGLGPDALSLPPGELGGLLAKVRRPIKAALLDQRLLAGVGNIYADEALYRAGIHPAELACEIPATRAHKLGKVLGDLLALAVEAGGSTLRDYRAADGQAGAFQLRHAVYGRGGQPCLTCGQALESGVLASRTTVWCPSCQGAC